MRKAFGGLVAGIGLVGMFAIWLYTTVIFFATGQTLWALLSLFVPPADLVLPFLISPALGLAGLASTVVAFIGFAIYGD